MSDLGRPVIVRDGRIDIEEIQAAIRTRIARRAGGGAGGVDPAELAAERANLIDPLAADWNLPRDVWDGMWPPNFQTWNLDEDFPIRSHRTGLGRALVALKRLQRSVIGLLLRPVLVRQAEINRTLALVVRTLTDEVARERVRVRARDQRLARIGAVVRELRGDAEPLVVFEDEP